MTNEKRDIILKPVGFVMSEVKQPEQRDWTDVISDIVIDSQWTEALDNLEEFSHIIVLYWMHQSAGIEPPTKVHPKGRRDLPLVGLFASRSPQRPNPIGKTVVRLLERKGNVLKVQGLDAIDGTPVIDIKPYIPGDDFLKDARVPAWISKIHNMK